MSLSGVRHRPYWLDDPARPDPLPRLTRDALADLVIVGGGYAGLWAALRAKERDPARTVTVLEAGECGGQASGRNGGFVEPSLTHGFGNGLARWPQEMPELLRQGSANLDGLVDTVARYDIDCSLERTGELQVATRQHEVAGLAREVEQQHALGREVSLLDAAQVRDLVHSPTYLAAVQDPEVVLVEPARLAWGLRAACLERGVTIHENTPVGAVERSGTGVELRSKAARVHAQQVVLATNAAPPLLRRLRLMTVPVFDYSLMTEPLDAGQRAEIGWRGRQGIGDAANLFHYYRLTRDDRLLFGGYDAVYRFGSGRSAIDRHGGPTYELLARNLVETFPQLAGVRLSHAWGGVIDTCTRFCAFYGTAMGGRLAYAGGYTGLGVAATRFAADVCLDLLAGSATERTELSMVRERPLPFPPEPARWLGIQATRRSMLRADSTGHANLWLTTMDKLGLGFDS
ncbi:MAG: FAD-binding oxidoreductase [Actinomycetota bacterium]|nr:FAD-binding oxidoreductase [Actinomycetota bacterium]